MKILRHGTLYGFECEKCGCQFTAGVHECVDCGFFIKARCPDCDSEVKNPNKKEGEDKDG